MNKIELIEKIKNLKKELGNRLVIPTHHYQARDIVKLGDFVGDSYKLAVECSKTNADFIVFCGVLFMAEGAKILSKPNQKVLLPEPTAGCPMADMASIELVEKSYRLISEKCNRAVVPVVYINSYADLKSFCGEKAGAVCTSSNAPMIIDYYLKKDKAVLFFPDYYLGINTVRSMNIDNQYIVKVKRNMSFDSSHDAKYAKIFLWDGFCPIHQRFTEGDIKYLKSKYPNIKIIVHPECKEEVVNKADITGSTEKIYNMIKDSPSGSVWGVGTETTFVERLALDYPDKTIVPLRESKCVNMVKINLTNLASSLDSIIDYINGKGKLKYEIMVDEKYKENAKKALKKMIEIVEE